MAAMVAARWNTTLKAFRDRFVQGAPERLTGKPVISGAHHPKKNGAGSARAV
jgi:hypothetical protein